MIRSSHLQPLRTGAANEDLLTGARPFRLSGTFHFETTDGSRRRRRERTENRKSPRCRWLSPTAVLERKWPSACLIKSRRGPALIEAFNNEETV
jgi:hypothetical protein